MAYLLINDAANTLSSIEVLIQCNLGNDSKESQLQVEDDDPEKMLRYYRNAESDEKERLSGSFDESCASLRLNYGFHDRESSGSSYGYVKSDGDCFLDRFLAREIEWSHAQSSTLEAKDEDDDLGEQEVTSKFSAMDTEEEEDSDLREQEATSKLLAMDTEEEREGDDQGEETSWVEAFAEELASLQDCVEEEGDDLLPNPFYQDKWVRGWERAPKHKLALLSSSSWDEIILINS